MGDLPTKPPADAVDSNSTSNRPYMSVEPEPSTEPPDGAYVSNSVPILNPSMGLCLTPKNGILSL